MRYFIRAYPMHELEEQAIARETAAGLLEADLHDGVVDGIADQAAIERLAAQGVVVQAIASVPESLVHPAIDSDSPISRNAPAIAPAKTAEVLTAAAERTLDIRMEDLPGSSDAEPEYWLATLFGGVSDRSVAALEDAGAEIVERDPSGAFVLRVMRDVARVRALPFVGDMRAYGSAETLHEAIEVERDSEPTRAGVSLPAARGALPHSSDVAVATLVADVEKPSTGQFEAICHRREDQPRVRQEIEALGGRLFGGDGRVVRFILNRMDLAGVAALPGVASVSRISSPRVLAERARLLIGLESAGPPLTRFPYDGAGEIVGVADTGLDQLHPDFSGKQVVIVALGRPGNARDPDGHGTHVAGIIVGTGAASLPPAATAGTRGPLCGIAPAADLYFQSVLDTNGGLGGLPESLGNLFDPAYVAGVRVHNNSWGAYLQARYDSMALDVDEFVFNHPDFLPVIAAGNEGSCRPGLQARTGFVDYPSLGAPATAKNGLTVGASRSNRDSGGMAKLRWKEAWPQDFQDGPIGDQTISGDEQCLAAFSSRGPCDDMRIKPDVVAPGTDIASTRSRDAPLANFWGAYRRNRHYAYMGGTSMACPVVAGCAALVRQYFRKQRAYATPSAALLKAALINGAHSLTGADSMADPSGMPNYHQGFGRVDMGRTLPGPTNPAFELFFVDTWNRDGPMRFTSRSARRRWEFAVTIRGELRITVAWTDPPARGLQNQLRIILDTRRNGQTINWIGNEKASAPLKTPAHDPRMLLPGQANVLTRDPQNNVQVIRADVEAGSYTLALFADGLIQLPQDFALVASFPFNGAQVRAF